MKSNYSCQCLLSLSLSFEHCSVDRNWWPFFVTLFYVLSPLPTVLARRYQDDVGSSNACKELALFLTTGIVISAFGLPIVLARSGGPVVSFFLFLQYFFTSSVSLLVLSSILSPKIIRCFSHHRN